MEIARRPRRSPCPSRRRRSSVAVGRKVRELRRLVPGTAAMPADRLVPGTAAMPADRLLLHTADYIAQLRAKVELLRALSELCEGHAHGDTPS